MGTLKIGSSSNKKGVTIEPKTVLFNGNNVNEIMSGSTSIWEKEVKIPFVGTATASSSNNSDRGPGNAFDGSHSTKWISGNSSTNTLTFTFTTPITKLLHFVVYCGASNTDTSRTYSFEVSTDGSSYTPLATITDTKFDYDNLMFDEKVKVTNVKSIRLKGTNGVIGCTEIELYGKI